MGICGSKPKIKPENEDEKYAVTSDTKFKWSRRPLPDDDLRKLVNEPTDEMREKYAAEKKKAKETKTMPPPGLTYYLKWEWLTKGNDTVYGEEEKVVKGELPKHDFCQSLIEKCYHLEDIYTSE